MEINEQMKKEVLKSKNKALLGEKVVEIKKLTPANYKKVMGVVNSLPNILMEVFVRYFKDKEDRKELFTYMLIAGEIALDEIIAVASILTGIEEKLLEEEIPVEDIIQYFIKLLQFNNLDKAIKNIISPLLKEVKTSQQ